MQESYRDLRLKQFRAKLSQPASSDLIAQIHDQKEEFAGIYTEGLEDVQQRLPAILTKTVPTESIRDEDVPVLEGISEVYYQLASVLSPYYAGFATWVDKILFQRRVVNGQNPKLIFEGRDSLGFAVADKKMFGNEWIYSPMNRAAVYSLFCTGNQGNIPRNERKRIVDFHQRKDLIGEELCFVDFGFRATLPRIQQLMLIDEGYPVSPDNQMLLALQTQGGSIFDQKVRDDSFKMSKDELTGFDLQLKDNIRGFINEGIGGGGGSGLTLTALNGSGGSPHADMRFFSVLQELPSYIKETGEEAMLHPLKRTQRTASYTVGSTAEIVAKYAFMRGLMAADLTVPAEKEDAFEAINTFYALYRTYPDLYTLLEDFNKKCINDKRFTQEVVNLNSDLSQRGLQQIFT